MNRTEFAMTERIEATLYFPSDLGTNGAVIEERLKEILRDHDDKCVITVTHYTNDGQMQTAVQVVTWRLAPQTIATLASWIGLVQVEPEFNE